MLLIAKQSKHKTLDAAPDIQPLLAHIDRDQSAPFASALVEGFLNSDQAASDRWALALGGLLGDNRIITLLLPRINDWCENSRHKLAEYAAQAISLLPGNEPLMVLDTLSNRYRSKFKNVGKACAEAFNAAAAARGSLPDELVIWWCQISGSMPRESVASSGPAAVPVRNWGGLQTHLVRSGIRQSMEKPARECAG